MLGLSVIQELQKLAAKDKVEIKGERYEIKNLVAATDDESVLKARIMLKKPDGKSLDVEVSVVVYQ